MTHIFSWCDDMGFNTADINNINLDNNDDAFDEDELEIINHARLIAGVTDLNNAKYVKKK